MIIKIEKLIVTICQGFRLYYLQTKNYNLFITKIHKSINNNVLKIIAYFVNIGALKILKNQNLNFQFYFFREMELFRRLISKFF